ncbi:MAG: hypothetical protein VE99_C0003G0040 [candidate division Kazan bacterium GW2011_GWC1_52_13]|nr:MAG: hypothetical protein VE99_C0003G0040 [candidate division Kazan bacterium GW2011_GWC1_52_13]
MAKRIPSREAIQSRRIWSSIKIAVFSAVLLFIVWSLIPYFGFTSVEVVEWDQDFSFSTDHRWEAAVALFTTFLAAYLMFDWVYEDWVIGVGSLSSFDTKLAIALPLSIGWTTAYLILSLSGGLAIVLITVPGMLGIGTIIAILSGLFMGGGLGTFMGTVLGVIATSLLHLVARFFDWLRS